MIVCSNCNHSNPNDAIQCEACYSPLPINVSVNSDSFRRRSSLRALIVKLLKILIINITKISLLKPNNKKEHVFPFTRGLTKYKFEIPLKSVFRYAHEPVSIESSLPFIGRQAELDALVERILFSNGGSFLVTGYRGVGKSSFVNQVIRNLELSLPWAEKYLGTTEILAVQLNLARPLQPSKLMHHIIRRLYDKLLEKNILSVLSSDLQEQLALAYRRTSFNMARSTSEGAEHNYGISELSFEAGKIKASLKPSLGYKRSNTQNEQASFLGYDDKASEYDIIDISRRLTNGYIKPLNFLQRIQKRFLRSPSKRIKLKIVFVFDEMDKLEEMYVEENGVKKLFIESLLGSLKNLFTTSGISFIFVAGKDLHERWLEDLGKGDSIYESVFAYDKYLPCMWTNINELCDTFIDQDALEGKSSLNHNSTWVGDITETKAMFDDFKDYLCYRGRGLPRRIIRGFNEYVQWHEKKPVLVFTHQDARRIKFYAQLQKVLLEFTKKSLKNIFEESFSSQQDKQQLGIYYLVDWVLRQGSRDFSLNDAVNASKKLSVKIALVEEVAPQIIRDVLEALLQNEYLQEVKLELSQAQVLNLNVPTEKLYKLASRRINEMSGVADIYDEEANLLRQVDNMAIEIQHYKIQEKIGIGGMATVYRAWDEQNARFVAIKILNNNFASNPQMIKRFKREAEIMSSLQHPNIVQCFDTGEAKRLFYIVMEYIDGINLSQFLEKQGKLDFNVVIHIINPIIEALNSVHIKGFFRNDIKPGNILFSSIGKVYLTDFGITKSYQGDMEVTGPILPIGTPHYISPEEWQNNPANVCSDVYSLGVTMYEMVAGRRPFEGDTVEEICQQHLYQLPIPPSRYAALPQAVELIILKCLEKNPEARFQSMDELGTAITQVIHDQPPVDLAPLLKTAMEEVSNNVEFVGASTVILESVQSVPPNASPIANPPTDVPSLSSPEPNIDLTNPVTHTQFPYLRLLKGPSAVGAIFTLKNDQIRLGRSSESEIILDSVQISRFHARIIVQNLQGRSFKGQNLEGANFSNADIRGANFTDANLRGADFSYAKAGFRLGGLITLLMFSLLISVLSGLFLPYFPINTIFLLTINKDPAGVLILFVLLVLGWFFAFLFIRQGLFIALVVVVVSATFSGMNALATSMTSVLILTLAITIAAAVGRKAVNIMLASSVIAALFMTIASGKTQPEVLVMVVIVTVATVALSLYMSRKALAGDKKYAIIRAFAILFGISTGTCFQKSDLTDANFTGATLSNTNLLGANITCTCWLNVKKFHLARFDNTYLEQPQVRQLVVTGQGQDLNFDHLNLNGINLKGANLQDTSFIGAELNHANLQDTNLSRAKLKQTQLNGTDFTGANLTGAYIEDWGITSDTKFNGVRCEYIYMRLPTKENPDPLRKPDNKQEVFADGDFGDFIQPIFDTLDLYHNQGVDPRAIAIAFKQLAENNPDAELEIVAMEKRGEDKFLLRAKTTVAASKSELSSQYFTTYNQLKALPEREIRLILAEKDNRIHCLENMVVTALSRPSFYSNVEKVGIMTNNPGGISQNMSGGHMDGGMQAIQGDNNQQNMNTKVSNFDLKGAQLAGGVVNAETVTANQIGGNITNYVLEQRQNLVETAKEVQELLQQMEQNYSTITSADKAIVVAKAIDEIEENPNFKFRVIEALKAGGVETFKNLVDHSLANKFIVSIEDWI